MTYTTLQQQSMNSSENFNEIISPVGTDAAEWARYQKSLGHDITQEDLADDYSLAFGSD